MEILKVKTIEDAWEILKNEVEVQSNTIPHTHREREIDSRQN